MEAGRVALEVPAVPRSVALDVSRRWDGAALASGLRGRVALSAAEDALHVRASLASPHPPRVPDAAAGTRVDGLWTFDVVELFAVAADGRYLELELGGGGHWLALAFDAPRRRAARQPSGALRVEREGSGAQWCCRCALPRGWLPEPLVRANAFASAGGELAAHHPVPGEVADFHRPHDFPALRVPRWEP